MSAQIAAGLLARARDDAAAVRASLPIADITDAIVAFHAQQAVEKSIKAVLVAGGQTFPFTHDPGRARRAVRPIGHRAAG